MRVLVTGARGQLGRACLDAFTSAGHQTAGIDLADGDLSQSGVAVRLLETHAPDRVIHAAAFTAVDLAESRRDEALAANAEATGLVAAACRARGCALTYVSTDYVFAGDAADGYAEDAPLAPINWYGETKARGEAAVRAHGPPGWQIVRTSWLFGHGPANFVLTIRGRLREGRVLDVVDDQRGCPTYAVDLAGLLAELAATGAEGIVHGTNGGVCSWFEFAREIARLDGQPTTSVRPCKTGEYRTVARRPACSVLIDTRLAQLGIAPRPAWQDALARYLARLQQEPAEEAP